MGVEKYKGRNTWKQQGKGNDELGGEQKRELGRPIQSISNAYSTHSSRRKRKMQAIREDKQAIK